MLKNNFLYSFQMSGFRWACHIYWNILDAMFDIHASFREIVLPLFYTPRALPQSYNQALSLKPPLPHMIELFKL